MYLIVGLGNPGQKYLFTRHNVGFFVLDKFVQKLNLSEKHEHKALTYKAKIKNQDVLLVKPQTYMNLSGESVQPLMAFYKIPLENLLVIHDDIDQTFLSLKLQKNSSSGGQNGVKSVHEKLGTQDYARLKMGVGRPTFSGQSAADHVLQNFNSLEESFIPSWIESTCDAVETFIEKGFHKAASVVNTKIPHMNELIERQLVDPIDLSKNNYTKLVQSLKTKNNLKK
jgi:PTH1 family peptidyl-tRNA hydrolase